MKGGSLAVVALIGILVIAVIGSYVEWTSIDTPMPAIGWAMLWAGVIVSILLGVALMGLMFYSSRRGWDDDTSRSGFIDDDYPDERP